MQPFIDHNNDIVLTNVLHNQVFCNAIGKSLILLFAVAILVVLTAIGTGVLLVFNVVNYVWKKQMCMQVITLLCSIGTAIMLILFFREVSSMVDKYTEIQQRQLKEVKEEQTINNGIDALKQVKEKSDMEREELYAQLEEEKERSELHYKQAEEEHKELEKRLALSRIEWIEKMQKWTKNE